VVIFCFLVGVLTVMMLMAIADKGRDAALVFLWPGAFCMWVGGYGGHDVPGFFTYILANMLFYPGVAFSLRQLAIALWRRLKR